ARPRLAPPGQPTHLGLPGRAVPGPGTDVAHLVEQDLAQGRHRRVAEAAAEPDRPGLRVALAEEAWRAPVARRHELDAVPRELRGKVLTPEVLEEPSD